MNLLHPPGMKFEDSGLPFSQRRQGSYFVNGKQFNHKINALLESARTGQGIRWDFNFLQWHQQIQKPRLDDVSLLTLYRERAQMLRDEYRYIILAYSGGSDSDNILKAFVDNGIKLDEVWVDFPIKAAEKAGYVPHTGKDGSNMISEWYLVVKPDLDRLRVNNPEIKIHVSDTSENPFVDDNGDYANIVSGLSVFNTVERYRYIKKYVTGLNKAQSTCLVVGQDKPAPAINGDDYGFVFNDYSTYLRSDEDFNVEYFYWAVDYPALHVEQARKVWDYLLLHRAEAEKRILTRNTQPVAWLARENTFDHIVKRICYPKWDWSKHQVGKTGQANNTQFSLLFDTHKEERFYQAWKSNHSNLLATLSRSNLLTETLGAKELQFFANFHKLGTFKT